MTQTIAPFGAANSTQTTGFAGVIEREFDRRTAELNNRLMGLRMGCSENCVRSYRDAESSPRFDDLIASCRRGPGPRGISDDMLIDAAQTLVGERAVVIPAEAVEVSRIAEPDDRAGALAVLDEALAAAHAWDDAHRDRSISHDEANRFAALMTRVHRAAIEATLEMQRQAGRRTR